MTEPTIPSWSAMKRHYRETGSVLFPIPRSVRKGGEWDADPLKDMEHSAQGSYHKERNSLSPQVENADTNTKVMYRTDPKGDTPVGMNIYDADSGRTSIGNYTPNQQAPAAPEFDSPSSYRGRLTETGYLEDQNKDAMFNEFKNRFIQDMSTAPPIFSSEHPSMGEMVADEWVGRRLADELGVDFEDFMEKVYGRGKGGEWDASHKPIVSGPFNACFFKPARNSLYNPDEPLTVNEKYTAPSEYAITQDRFLPDHRKEYAREYDPEEYLEDDYEYGSPTKGYVFNNKTKTWGKTSNPPIPDPVLLEIVRKLKAGDELSDDETYIMRNTREY